MSRRKKIETVNPGITLRDAIKEFNAKNSDYPGDSDNSPQAQEFFRCHDIAHVIFDCDTSIIGEGKVKVWSMFGTTLGFRKHLQGYADANAFSLFSQYSWRHVLKSVLKLIITMPRVAIRARHMTKPWPWASHEDYLNMTLAEIREKFNIEPL